MNTIEILLVITQMLSAIALAIVYVTAAGGRKKIENDLNDLAAYAKHQRKTKRKEQKLKKKKKERFSVDWLPEDDEEEELLKEF